MQVPWFVVILNPPFSRILTNFAKFHNVLGTIEPYIQVPNLVIIFKPPFIRRLIAFASHILW